MAIARFSWASRLIEPSDMAPVLKRFTISLAGSTWSSGIDRDGRNLSRPRSVARYWLSSFTISEYCLKSL